MLFTQSFEQQSPAALHALPAVRQLPFSGVHVFAPPSAPPHLPPQHSASVVHALLSLMHWVAPHWPFWQTIVQHSTETVQPVVAGLHVPIGFTHSFVFESHWAEQQSLPVLHDAPVTTHGPVLPSFVL